MLFVTRDISNMGKSMKTVKEQLYLNEVPTLKGPLGLYYGNRSIGNHSSYDGANKR